MSFDALAWAAKQKPNNLAAKMALLALANYADERGRAYPSNAAIAEFGDMNPKTAIAALDRLEALGLIIDSGQRAGRSKQIKVYQLNLQSLPKTEASQKGETPKFSDRDSQKRVTDTVKDTDLSDATHLQDNATAKPKPEKPKADPFPCPDGVDPIDWEGLKANRRSKRAPFSEAAHRGIIKKLETYARDGWPPGPIVANAAERGWVTVFDTDEMKAKPNDRQPINRTGSQPRQEPVNPMVRAIAARQAERRNQPEHGLSGFNPANRTGSG